MTKAPSASRSRLPTRVAVSLVATLGLLGLLVLAAHAPPSRAVVRDRVVAWLSSSYAIEVNLDGLDYDLLRLRARARGMTLAARHTPDRPFFEADRVEVDLPTAVLGGVLALDRLEVSGARVTLAVGPDGRSNLPETPESTSSTPPERLDLREVAIDALDLTWRDEASGARAEARGLSLALSPSPGGTASGEVTIPSLEVRAQGLGVRGEVRADLRFDGRRLTLEPLEVTADLGRFTVDGVVDLLGGAPEVALRLSGAVDAAGLGAPAPPNLRLSGAVSVGATLEGPRRNPRIEVTAEGPALTLGASEPLALSLAVVHEEGGTRLESGELTLLGGTLWASGRTSWDESAAGALEIDLRGVSLARGARLWGLSPPPALATRLDGRGNLEWDAFEARDVRGVFHLSADSETTRHGETLGGRGGVEIQDGLWAAFADLGFAGAAVHALAAGQLEARSLGRSSLVGQVEGHLSDLERVLTALGVGRELPPDLQGVVRIEATLGGTLAEPRVRGAVTAPDVRVRGVGPLRGSSDFTFAEGRITVAEARLSDGANTLVAAGSGDLEQGTLDVAVSADLADLARLSSSLPPALALESGALAVSGRVAGMPGAPAVSARVEARGWRGAGWRLDRGHLDAEIQGDGTTIHLAELQGAFRGSPLRLTSPGRITLGADSARVDGLSFGLGASSTLGLEGALSPSPAEGLHATLEGEAADLMVLVAPDRPDLRVAGAVDVDLTARGPLDSVTVGGRAVAPSLEIRRAGAEEPVRVAVAVALEDGLLLLQSLEASWYGARARAKGRLPLRLGQAWLPSPVLGGLPPSQGNAVLDATVDVLSPAAIGSILGRPLAREVEGEVRAWLHTEWSELSLAAARGRLELERASFELPTTRIALAGPAAAVLEAGVLRLEGLRWQGPFGELAVEGRVGLDPRTVDLALRGDVDLRVLDAFFPVAAVGRVGLDLGLEAGGDSGAQLLGSASIEGVGFVLQDPNVDVSGLQGRLVLARDRIHVRELEARVNGGQVQVSGVLDPERGGPLSLEVRGEGLGLTLYPDLRGEMDLDLAASGTLEDPKVTGRVELVHAAYRGTRSPYRVYTDLVERWAPPQRASAVVVGPSPLLESLALDIALSSRNDLAWENAHGRLRAQVDLALRGTAANPSLDGVVALRPGGDVLIGGTIVDVRSGSLRYQKTRGLEPRVALNAYSRISGYDVELRATGGPDDLELTLASQPPLTHADLVALVATGAVSSESGSTRAQASRDVALGTASATALATFTEITGLRRVRVSSAPLSLFESSDRARLTVSLQVSRALEVVHSQSLSQGGNTGQGVVWHPFRRVDATVYRVSNDWVLEAQQRLELGGPKATRAEQPEAPPRVSSVVLRGGEGADEDRLRGRLRLKEGDRFDFFQWQDDQDRLVRALREDDHREARVQATRSAEADGGLALEYRLRPGPLTRLRVEGAALSRRDREWIEAAWTWAPSDPLLSADLEKATRVVLLGKGHAEAVVEVRVDRLPGPDPVKEIVLRIDPGPRARRREIVFEGAREVPPERLRDVVEAAGLAQSGFVERAALEAVLVDHYVSLGFLGAQAFVAPARVEDGVARLAVTIDEGPRYRLSAVDVALAPELRPAGAPPRLGLAPGDVYRPVADAEARLALERHYQALGYNDATVDPTRETDPEAASVALRLAVRGGRRQVVSEVAWAGGEEPPSSVRAVFDRQIGEPASLEAWGPARREVFDSGLYRDLGVDFEPTGTAGADEDVRAVVSLEPWPRWNLSYGLRVTDLASQVGRATIPTLVGTAERRNLFRYPLTGRLHGLFDRRAYGVSGELNAARFLGRAVLSRLFLTHLRFGLGPDEIPDEIGILRALTIDVTQLGAEQRWRRGHRELWYGYVLEHATVSAESDALPDAIRRTQTVAKPNLTGVFDYRDNPLDARRGFFHSSNFEFGFGAIGSDVDFLRYLAKQYVYRPVGPLVLAGGVRLGLATGLDGVQNPLSSLLFTAGGGSTVRGYAEDSLGPVGERGRLGGSGLLILNAEARFPLFWWFGGATFVDAGNVWETASQISLAGLQYGLGLGLRLQTPFIALRLDLAFPVPRREQDRAWRLHFGIGQAF